MKKLIKIVLGIVLAIILLAAVAVALFALFFDANSFRGQIAAQAKNATGRELVIGDIHLSIFPTLGARIQNVSLSNAAGFGAAPFASVGAAEVGVRLLPLLRSRAVQVSSVTVDGLQLNLAKHADGKTNWDDLVEKISQPKAAAQPGAATSGSSIKSIDIAGISVSNAALNYRDDQAQQSYALSKLKLDTGAIEPGKAFDFDLSFATQLTQPAITADTEISAKLVFDLTAKAYQASKLKLKVKASGKQIPNGTQTAEFGADLSYDGSKGTLSLANGRLDAGGLSATASLQGTGLNGSAGRFAGPLSIKPFSPRELLKTFGMSLETADADALKNASLSAQIEGNATAARLSNIVLELDQTHLTGNLGVGSFATQALDFVLKADTLDADRYLPPPQKQAAATPAARKAAGGPSAPSNSSDATVLPVDALEKLNASGTLDVGKFKLQNLKLSDVHLKLAAPRGREKRIDLAGKLYGGTLDNTTRITPGSKPTVSETLKLASISAGPLLLDLNGKDTLTGTGDVAVNLSGAGRTVGELKRALDGNLSFSFKNGAVKGFNLGQIIRKGEAFMSGQQYDESAVQETDFTELSASGRMQDGVLTSDDLNASSPLFRVGGAGKVDIAAQTIDYVAKPTIVNTASGQGGKQLADLNGVVIPIHVTGTFAQPRYSIDVKAALQQKATEKVQQRLSDQIDKKLGAKNPELSNQLKEGLGALFGRKKKHEEAPAQSPPPNP
ncbi:MAG: AsmA family protein [Nevskia sp.]|nr:AsmA family protein [Nevskia sp.]